MRASAPIPSLLAALLALGCEGARESDPPATSAETAAHRAPAKAAEPVLPFIADDYEAARAQALERDLPIFVESWAPW